MWMLPARIIFIPPGAGGGMPRQTSTSYPGLCLNPPLTIWPSALNTIVKCVPFSCSLSEEQVIISISKVHVSTKCPLYPFRCCLLKAIIFYFLWLMCIRRQIHTCVQDHTSKEMFCHCLLMELWNPSPDPLRPRAVGSQENLHYACVGTNRHDPSALHFPKHRVGMSN